MNLRPQNSFDIVGAQHYVDFPLAPGKIKHVSLCLLLLTYTLQFVAVALEKSDLGIVLSVHEIDLGLEGVLDFVI